ncbi:hypothetical protein NHB34_00700 [Polynucleobacter sp. MWH-UH19D]|uniref:hypothetical protein n=1 Tax=Polynucleobacter sp. MWH-UH19D TaxID=1855610 RepID=UPI003364E769
MFQKFRNEFKLVPYDQFQELNSVVETGLIDAMYLIKSGERDDYYLSGVPNLIHAVFPQKLQEMHGDIYAFVSKWLSAECSNRKIPYVPHIVNLPNVGTSLRPDIGIPSDATVFGCYGGSDSFNLNFVIQTIANLVEENSKIYFLFMNIDPFIDHPRVIFLPGNPNPKIKSKFINTCDAMIHARGIGESFGLACGEFSTHNKPVITYALSPQRNHIDVLGRKAILYRGPEDLRRIFWDFDKTWASKQDWDCYTKDFSPNAVMAKFDSVFLSDTAIKKCDIAINLSDKVVVQAKRLKKKIRSLSRKLYF